MSNYLTFAEYSEVTGLSQEEIDGLIRSGKIRFSVRADGTKSIYHEGSIDGLTQSAAKLKQQAVAKAAEEERQNRITAIGLSTLSALPGNTDFSVIGVVTAECVFGMNVFRDLFAGLRDVVGGRSDASEKVLKDLKQTCLTELREEAYKVGADAVLGVDLDYSEFSGQGKSMLFLVASGTAVKIIEDAEDQGSRPS